MVNTSKVFSRSQNIPPTESLLFIDFNISLISVKDAATMELLILNPYCFLTSMLLVHICLYNLEYISFSHLLDRDVKRETGLSFVARSLSPFL